MSIWTAVFGDRCIHVAAVMRGVNQVSSRTPQVYREGDAQQSLSFDRCQTPAYALDPLLPYLDPSWTIWECAAGEGNLSRALRDRGFTVVATDLLTEHIGEDVEGGRNLFHWQPPHDGSRSFKPYPLRRLTTRMTARDRVCTSTARAKGGAKHTWQARS